MMFRETSSEEFEEKSDNESDYEASDSSDGNDDGSLENRAINTRSRAKSVMISIPEATKMRPRNSGISIREPTESPILLGPSWKNRRKRNTARRPAKRFKNPIVATSSAATIVPVAVFSQAQVNNVNDGTITTSLVPRVNVNTGNITTSFESGLNPSSSSLQDFILGSSSSGSNIERPWSISASGPIPSNKLLAPLGSSSSSVQSHANITRQMTSSSQPSVSPAMPNYQQQHHPSSSSSSSSMYFSLHGLDQIYGRPYDLRQQPPLMLQHVRCLDLNQPANEDAGDEKMVEEKDEGLDLNQPANEDAGDEKMVEEEDEGLDLNQPVNEDEDDDEKMVEEEDEGLDLNQPANEGEDDDKKMVEEEDEGLDLNQLANEDDGGEKKGEEEDEGLDLNQPARDEW